MGGQLGTVLSTATGAHLDSLSTVSNLGTLYRDQDKLDEAEQMYV